ncbi:hypothetical protein DACRYDRAFT_105606 [Dacryopinax primogenitus]|uniref:Uncharacterized protein n=1 Tax=Dacryopinax primogenitus (strain DJM 731) TaxID=1858805 RepID=M5FZI6_DACPD|nr:uncharacterized protein DACRYDRAFT_105606 [Dacryopinax primogenitus]EJU03446.1 hypothetical protein DACRYDRAFT_105606 [Dacryopinax primogenitus]
MSFFPPSIPHIACPMDSIEQLQVDEELRKIDEEENWLHRRRSELRQERNAASPVSKLPNECLSMIFDLASKEEHARSKENRGIMRDRPTFRTTSTVVSQVSNHWRAVALTTPRLWSSIFLIIGRSRPRQKNYIEGLLEHVRRAKAAPIDMELSSGLFYRPGEYPLPELSSLELEIVSDLLPACRSLKVCLPPREASYSVLARLLIQDMPQLEELSLSGDAHSQAWTISMPLCSERLRSIELRYVQLHPVTLSQLAQVSSLRMNHSSIVTTKSERKPEQLDALKKTWQTNLMDERQSLLSLQVLQGATNLRHLTLQYVFVATPPEDLATLTFTRLDSLELAAGIQLST